ncbi:CRISPR-associated helicase Cas3' [Luteipulveratus mongoliensis]|uniref:CRISPR-associated protein Cas3 n=1 Tax=Luteipulveratus mongoliensis TaxID=571913 RepID=A0A0K1JPU9_9MICO|nr:CRISPR-associated helicase Cas3' [Luteipulveratus mongoliensis]AKU18600.1 hypothetical protein VV02_03375 [Luteipulveratus mongoliensis]
MMEWSDAARSVWGKTDPKSDTSMPLVRHLEDTAAVAGHVWDHWLPTSIKQHVGAALPRGEADGRTLLTWLAGVHDVGKASPAFAVKARKAPGFGHLVGEMEAQGLVCGTPIAPLPPHCRVGHSLVERWLERFQPARRASPSLAVVVGGHHGVQPTVMDLRAIRREHLGATPEWEAAQTEILTHMAQLTGADDRLHDWLRQPLPLTSQVLLTASVVVADWLASDTLRFPHQDPSASAVRLARADLDRDLLGPWHATDPGSDVNDVMSQRFPRLKGVSANSVQTAAVRAARATSSPCLMLIEAPMGAGKTEAALMVAEVLAHRFGQGGVLMGLPTMATSGAMFGRVLDWLDHANVGVRASVTLAHSKAGLDDRYAGLVANGRVRGVGEPEGERDSVAVVSSWLRGRRKGSLASMVVGTIDQALFGALQVRHVALRQLALAGKVVVLDEVHAADAYMQRYLVRVLEWLGAYGTPVILLSATLPPARRAELLGAYARGRDLPPVLVTAEVEYPRISVQSADLVENHVPWDGRRTSVTVEALPDGVGHLVAAIRPVVADGACVAVIHNTVRRAQGTYDALVAELDEARVVLLHSQFVAVDRMKKERALRDALGPQALGRPQGFVVVGTQVLEQSLDIDVDLMVSELAPVDLILQRIGRLHRHPRGVGERDRPPTARRPRLLLTGVRDWSSSPPEPDRGSQAVYGQSALLRAATVLAPHLDGAPVQVPDDVSGLVDAAYAPGLPCPAGWETAWAEAEAAARTQDALQARNAGDFLLGSPTSTTLVGWLEARVSDTDDPGARPQVRDGEDGIEVVVIQDVAGELRALPCGPIGGRRLPLREADIDDKLAKQVAGYTLRLPMRLCRGPRGERVVDDLERQGREFAGWQRSRWLTGVLVLSLDHDLKGEVDGTGVRYDLRRGLLVGADG